MTPQRAAAHGLALAVVAAVGTLAWWRATRVWPFDIDNLVSFTYAHETPTFLYQEGSGNGGYRPVGLISIWLQNLVVGLSPRPYFAANLAMWLATAAGLYALVWALTRSLALATAAALVLVVDGRVYTALIQVVDRQNTSAALLGVGALLLVMRSGEESVSRARAWGVFGLLAGAALSKETGLAFAAAVAVWAGLWRPEGWRRLLVAGAGAVALYAGLRLATVADTTFCDTMGLWNDTRQACFGSAGEDEVSLRGAASLGQHAYNAGAMLIGTFLPFLFDKVCALSGDTPSASTLAFFSLTSALAVVGWVTRPRITLPFLALVLANGALGFMLYRTRNQLIGMVGVYATAAVGAQWVLTRISAPDIRRVAALSAGIVLSLWVVDQGRMRADDMREEVQSSMQSAHEEDPCVRVDLRRIRGTAYVDRDVLRSLKSHYRLPDPSCQREIARLDKQ